MRKEVLMLDNVELTSEKELVKKIDIVEENSSILIPECSFFRKPISNIHPYENCNLKQIYDLIKSANYSETTHTLRAIEDSEQSRSFKAKNFDYVTFSGTFDKRSDKSLISHSNLLAIDFDHVTDIKKLKKSLLEDRYFETELMFTSPSGDGLKWVIPIDLNQGLHRDYFKAVSNYINYTYQIEIDQSGSDISRACFIPHDADVFINHKYI